MEESCSERQENELQAIQAIYMDDFQDLREKPEHPPKVCLKLTPLQSVVAKEVYARVELIVQYSADYPDRSPKISLCNATGISDEDLSKLQNELQLMAADLVGEVMVLQLAHHVQTCLHKHNKPQLSFYEKMMANKQKEEERKLAAKREKQQMEIRANKEREENEKREIEEELQRREEAMRESKRRRTVVITEKNSKADQPASTQSLKTRDGEKSPVMETPPTLQKKHSGNSIALFQPSSPKKTDTIIGPGSSILRRRRSSESLPDDSFTGTRVITFSSKGEQVVHCGKCLGQGSSGSRVYSAMNVTLGELNAVCEWSLSAATTTSNQQHDLQGRLLKQVSSVKQEILSLANRVSHPNLTHYLAINVQETASSVKVQVLVEYVGGGDLSLRLRSGGLPLEQLREYTQQLVEALAYLHGKAVVHKDLRLTSCRLDCDGNMRLADYSAGKRLSDLHQVYGGNRTELHGEVSNKTTSRYGKTEDIYSLGMLVLSLALGEIITGDVEDIPTALPAPLRDFLSNCLKKDERNRMSSAQLLGHSFITPVISRGLSNGKGASEKYADIPGAEGRLSPVNQPEHEEPVPDFSFFSGVPGKSRVKCEFEELQFLGKGGFGNVIKVRNKLDNCLYAVKRIPLNPKSSQFTKRIMREVQLISRLNHENVVRYYNSWIENAEEQEENKSLTGQNVAQSSVSTEDSLLKLNKIEAPSMRGAGDNVEESWWQGEEEANTKGSDWSSSGSQESFRSPPNTSSKSHSISFFSSKSESSEGIVFNTNIDESVLQFGDLLDTESEDSDEGEEAWQETGSESSTEPVRLQYLYIQMEYCEKSTLRNLIDEGLHQDEERVWRLLREIVEGLAHIHSQGIIHRDLKPVNLFLDFYGRIKIGDFGLATTHGMTRGGMGPDVQDSTQDQLPSSKSNSSAKESMTGKVGTTLYVAPELGKRAGVRVKYSQKVDLYSLGIIFFEMCFKPLSTSMERVHVLGNLRTERIIFPSDFDQKRLSKQTTVLKWLLKHNPEERPTSQELLQSQYIPPKIEDGQLDEVLKHTLASSNSTRYQRLMKAMFSQHVSPVRDVTYDFDMFTGQVSSRAILAQQVIHESVKSVFLQHGALRLRTSLLAPRTKLLEQLDQAVSLMDHSGALVALPFDLRIPFARYVARNGVCQMKRFDIGCVYRVNRILGAHPKELYECVFDIVTSTPENLVPDAEVLLSVAEIIREFPSLYERSYYIRINHTALLKSFLASIGITDERQLELLKILQETRGENDRSEQINAFIESLQFSEHNATALSDFLNFEGPVSKLREHLIGTMKRKTWVGQTARQAFHDLETIVAHTDALEINLPVVVNTSMVYNFQHFSGLVFQFVAANTRKRKRGGVDILAAGGRYDKLINSFRRAAAEATHPSPGAVGVSIAIEKIVASVLDDQDSVIPCAYNVLVCSAGHNPMHAERMRIARDLWKAKIKATISYETMPLEELQESCKEGGIQYMVVLKEQEPGSVRVRSLDKEKVSESRIPIRDLVDHLQGKLSSRPETTDSSMLPGNKGTGQQSNYESSCTFVPEMKVSFNTQEKMAWNTKKRYESVMTSKIKPLLVHIGSKNAVEIIGVDLPGSVVRCMSALLDLDANEDAFDASVATIADKNPRYKKYIGRVCDDIRELKVSKKVPIVIVYSVKDEMFKMFF